MIKILNLNTTGCTIGDEYMSMNLKLINLNLNVMSRSQCDPCKVHDFSMYTELRWYNLHVYILQR